MYKVVKLPEERDEAKRKLKLYGKLDKTNNLMPYFQDII